MSDEMRRVMNIMESQELYKPSDENVAKELYNEAEELSQRAAEGSYAGYVAQEIMADLRDNSPEDFHEGALQNLYAVVDHMIAAVESRHSDDVDVYKFARSNVPGAQASLDQDWKHWKEIQAERNQGG